MLLVGADLGHPAASAAAPATSPLPVSPTIGTGERYRWIARRNGLIAQEQLTRGCHVHVSVASAEEGVAVLDRAHCQYSSYRSRMWGRWPSAGPGDVHGCVEACHAQVRSPVGTGVLRDEGMACFDARISHRYATVEVRIADVCPDPAARVWRCGEPPPDISTSRIQREIPARTGSLRDTVAERVRITAGRAPAGRPDDTTVRDPPAGTAI